MVVTRRPLFYGLCLLIGVLLFGIAGLLHPVLSGDGAAQLTQIAHTRGWRGIHWSLLFGLAFMYAGLIGVSLRHADTAGAAPARAGSLLGALAFSVWSVNILFMVGSGWHLAATYTASDTGLTGTHAVFVYDMIHPMGLAAERLATFVLGLVAYVFGWAIRNGGIWTRWLVWMAWAVALVCAIVALAFSELKPFMYFAQGLFVVWLGLVGVRLLLGEPSTKSP